MNRVTLCDDAPYGPTLARYRAAWLAGEQRREDATALFDVYWLFSKLMDREAGVRLPKLSAQWWTIARAVVDKCVRVFSMPKADHACLVQFCDSMEKKWK